MASRAQPLAPGLAVAAALAAAVTVGLVVLPLAAVVWRAAGFGAIGQGDWAALRFTITQAVLSAAISLALAIPAARALARRQFRARRLLILLMGAPFILPVIVAVLGILAVFGRAGAFNDLLAALGAGRVSVYGLGGVVLAHVFFNLPLAIRLLLQGWQDIPGERLRLAAALGFSAADVQRHLELPMLRARAPAVFVTIFLICLSSFAVALILGGGPRATTLELAIFQAFRLDFDLGRAATLAAGQLALCAAAALAMARLVPAAGFGAGLDRPAARWDHTGLALRLQDALVLTACSLFLMAPVLALLASGMPHLPGLPSPVWMAAARSLGVAAASGLLALALALPLALAAAAGGPRGRLAEVVATLPLAASSLVLGTGLFLLLHGWAGPATLALPATAVVNALMALPFCLRALLPAARELRAGYGRLADSLDLRGAARLRLLTLPRLRRPLGFATGLATALSMGDLGVIALFGDQGSATLPLQIYRLMGAYRMHEAAGAAVLLLCLSLTVFWICDRGGRGHA